MFYIDMHAYADYMLILRFLNLDSENSLFWALKLIVPTASRRWGYLMAWNHWGTEVWPNSVEYRRNIFIVDSIDSCITNSYHIWWTKFITTEWKLLFFDNTINYRLVLKNLKSFQMSVLDPILMGRYILISSNQSIVPL
jgi:hypothetical protein